jgi:hypothetical protein
VMVRAHAAGLAFGMAVVLVMGCMSPVGGGWFPEMWELQRERAVWRETA